MMMTELEKVWLACAIDGEGWIGLTRNPGNKQYRTRIELANTNLQFTQRAYEITGKGSISIDRERKIIRGWNPVYMWRIGKMSDCLEILNEIYPYLIIKKEKAQRVLLFLKFRQQKGKWSRYGIVEQTLAEGGETKIQEILKLL